MQDYYLQIVLTVITIIGAILTKIVIPYIKGKVTVNQLEQITTWIEIFVYSAQRLAEANKIEMDARKELVMEKIKTKASELGITISESDLDEIRRSVVKMLEQVSAEVNVE